jgi:acylphosphatase
MMKKALEIRVIGRVQGVWFRGSAREKALVLNLTGWVRNEADGSVLLHAYGEEENLEALKEWCNEGPIHARVERLEITPIEWEPHPTFEIHRR